MQTNMTTSVRFIIYSLLTAGFLLSLLVKVPGMDYVLGILAILAFIVSFVGAFRTFQIIGTSALIIGFALILSADVPVGQWLTLFDSMALLLALLFLLPFINDVITAGGYGQALRQFIIHRSDNAGRLYQKTGLVAYILCIFLFFAAIPAVYRVLKQVSEQVSAKFASQAILRSFALATIWSPIEIFIAYVATMTHVDYLQLLPWLFLFSVVLTTFDWLRGGFVYRHQPVEPTKASENVDSGESQAFRKNLVLLGFALVLLISINACLHTLFGYSFFEAMSITLLPFTFLWALSTGKLKRMGQTLKGDLPNRTRSLQNFVVLFVGLGFFNEAVEIYKLPDLLQTGLLYLSANPPVLFVTIQLLSLLLMFIGVHPFVSLGILGTMIGPLLDTISPVSLSIVLLTSNLAGDAAGTYNTPVTLMQDLTKVNPYRISVWNLPFALLYGTTGTVLATILL